MRERKQIFVSALSSHANSKLFWFFNLFGPPSFSQLLLRKLFKSTKQSNDSRSRSLFLTLPFSPPAGPPTAPRQNKGPKGRWGARAAKEKGSGRKERAAELVVAE